MNTHFTFEGEAFYADADGLIWMYNKPITNLGKGSWKSINPKRKPQYKDPFPSHDGTNQSFIKPIQLNTGASGAVLVSENKGVGWKKLEDKLPKIGDKVIINTMAMQGRNQVAIVLHVNHRDRRIHVQWIRPDGQQGRKSSYDATSLLPYGIPHVHDDACFCTNKHEVILDKEFVERAKAVNLLSKLIDAPQGKELLKHAIDTCIEQKKSSLHSKEKMKIDMMVASQHNLQKEIAGLHGELNKKMTRPSIAQELIDAEQYVDDYNELKNQNRRKQFAYKQRMKKKLERIKKVNEEKEGVDGLVYVSTFLLLIVAGLSVALAAL